MRKQINKFQWVNLFSIGLTMFLCVSITQAQLPDHWESEDIGDVLLNGDAFLENDTFYISGSGADIYGTADAFHFAFQPALGDCRITAHVAKIQHIDDASKAVVMIRETLEPGSRNAFVMVTPLKGTRFQWREVADAESSNYDFDITKGPPVWIRLERRENEFHAYYAVEDTLNWIKSDSVVIEMAEETYIGLGVTAHNNTADLCESRFSDVVVEPGIDYPDAIMELTASELSVYPNPVTDNVTLEISDNYFAVNNSVTIFNNLGQIMQKETVNSSRYVLDLSDIPQGLYFIELNNENGSVVKKLIKQ